jgi:2-polyprenyl-3-methyl-5-hydroxy-6-metoxy-1,4-benzoquinol methylase
MGADFDEYWRRRHEEQRGRLASVGNISASESQNTASYAVKKRALVDVLRDLGSIDLRGKRVLDAGCGIGIMSELLYALGAQVTGVDVSSVAIDEARLRCPTGSFEIASLPSLELGMTFDLVIAVDVLYHLVDDGAWLQALGRLATHGRGQIAILDQLRAEPFSPAAHVQYRTMATYEAAFGTFGLVRREVGTPQFAVFERPQD